MQEIEKFEQAMKLIKVYELMLEEADKITMSDVEKFGLDMDVTDLEKGRRDTKEILKSQIELQYKTIGMHYN